MKFSLIDVIVIVIVITINGAHTDNNYYVMHAIRFYDGESLKMSGKRFFFVSLSFWIEENIHIG